MSDPNSQHVRVPISRTIGLPANYWRALDRLAVLTDSRAVRGINKGKHTWRAFFRRLIEDPHEMARRILEIQDPPHGI